MGDAAEFALVPADDGVFAFFDAFEFVELRYADGGLDVGDAEVVADGGVDE